MTWEVEGGLVVVPHDPEAVIGLRADIIRAIYAKHGLTILEVRNGPWSGRTDNLKASYQDFIIAEKA